jgi:uncharacterized tellurite resistance protein B-like protein
MAFKEKYTPAEWKKLQYALLWVFDAVAGADNKIDKKEMKTLEKIVANSGKFFNDLARELFMEIKDSFQAFYDEFEKQSVKEDQGLKEVAELLKGKVLDETALNYKKTLIAIGVLIGHSSGSLFGSKLSDEEVAQVKRVGELLSVSVGDLERSPNLQQIIQSLNV